MYGQAYLAELDAAVILELRCLICRVLGAKDLSSSYDDGKCVFRQALDTDIILPPPTVIGFSPKFTVLFWLVVH